MTLESKIRMTAFAIICLIMTYFSVGYIFELYDVMENNTIVNLDDTEDIYIDGADFTPIFKLIGTGTNIFVSVILTGIYAVIILVTSLVLSILFHIIGLSKKRQPCAQEYYISKIIFITAVIISVLLGGFLSHFSLIIQLIIFNIIWSPIVFVLCVFPFRRIAAGSDNIMTLRKGDE